MICEKNKCCGCGSCSEICPKHCIEMIEDREGFLYPCIDDEQCINCNLCRRSCPVLNVKDETTFDQSAYIVQNKDSNICRESTSGGMFTAIASEIIHRNGIVYGAAYDKEFRVTHQSAKTISELGKFRNSKYVQSSLNGTFKSVQMYLEHGVWVCYSGTPCQIEAIKQYLKKEYENLILIDVVCRAVPSPLVWKKYLHMIQRKTGLPIKNIRFRDKKYGYKYSTMDFTDTNGNSIYNMGVESDPMHRAFFSDICDRPCCYQCLFKKRYRESDFTIWDCFQVGRFSKKLDNDRGATRVLIHSKKGIQFFETIKEQLEYVCVEPEKIVKGSKEMFYSVPWNEKRKAFMNDVITLGDEELFDKYFPDTLRIFGERTIRLLCLKMGVYSVIKKLFVKITRKY